MDFREIWLGMRRPERMALADRLGTSYQYLQKLSGGFGMPSLAMAERLQQALPQVDWSGYSRAKAHAGRRGSSH